MLGLEVFAGAAKVQQQALMVQMRSTLEQRLMRFKPEDYAVKPQLTNALQAFREAVNNAPHKKANPVLEIHGREKHMRPRRERVRNPHQYGKAYDAGAARKGFDVVRMWYDDMYDSGGISGFRALMDEATQQLPTRERPIMPQMRPNSIYNAMHRQTISSVPGEGDVNGINVVTLAAAAYFALNGGVPHTIGFSYAGNGAYSSCYIHKDTGLAVKFLRARKPDGTVLWLQHCRDMRTLGRARLYHPVVHGVYRLGDGYLAVMEPLTGAQWTPVTIKARALIEGAISDLADMPNSSHLSDADFNDFMTFKNKLPIALADGGRTDLHEGNFMCDEDGNLVLTDPFVGD